jgi:hypothetical protein
MHMAVPDQTNLGLRTRNEFLVMRAEVERLGSNVNVRYGGDRLTD